MTTLKDPLETLINQIKRLPSVGRKTAQRLTNHLLEHPSQLADLIAALTGARDLIHNCSRCGFYSAVDPCRFCTDQKRDSSVLCIVQNAADLQAIEETDEFRGRYHVLGGLVSPLEGTAPENLRLAGLADRIREEGFTEAILAVPPTVAGDLTSLYLQKELAPLGVKITRPASGIPMGAELEFLDRVTIARAFTGRREI